MTNDNAPFEIYATSTNTSVTDDAHFSLPANTPNLTEKVVVMRSGNCSFSVKCQHAAQFGAYRFLIYEWVTRVHRPCIR